MKSFISLMRSIDARIKLVLLLIVTVATFAPVTIFINLALFIISTLLLCMVSLRASILLKYARPTFIVILLVFLFNSFTFSNGLIFYVSGFSRAIRSALRIFTLVFASGTLAETTTQSQIVDAILFYMAPLKFFNVNMKNLSLVTMLVLRFLPGIRSDFIQIYTAQLSRASGIECDNIKGKVNSWQQVLSPLVFASLRTSTRTSDAIYIRGW